MRAAHPQIGSPNSPSRAGVDDLLDAVLSDKPAPLPKMVKPKPAKFGGAGTKADADQAKIDTLDDLLGDW